MPTRTRNAAPPAPEPEDQPQPETINPTEAAMAVFAGEIEAVGGIYTDPNGTPLGLYARIARIIESLPDVDPEGQNEHFKYKFLTINQIMGLLRPRLAQQKILIFPETVVERDPVNLTTKRGGTSLLTRLDVTFRVVDAINGESFTGQVVGYGDDSSDKGANKAYTAALKNFLVKLFLIGGDSDDLEADSQADKRAAARDAGADQVTKVDIGDANIEGIVRPGGRSEKATDAQVARVGQYIRDLELTPDSFVKFVDNVLGDRLDIEDDPEPWVAIRKYLEDLGGGDIGKLVARFDAVMNEAQQNTASEADRDEYAHERREDGDR